MSQGKNIVVIASEHKGNDFLEECHEAGWNVTLVTKEKLLDEPWVWTSLRDVKTVKDNARAEDYVRAVVNVAGGTQIDKVVGLDEFDVLVASTAREHLQLPGMETSTAIRFRDKLTMRNIASKNGIPCPEFLGSFNAADIEEYLNRVPAPWIVKPRNEVSAFGIRKCNTKDEVWTALHELDERNTWRDHPSQFLIERFIVGDVFHVDSIVNEGKVLACGVSKYGTTPFNVAHGGGVFTSSTVEYNSKERKELEKINVKLLKAFEYQKGVTHAEFLRSAEDGKLYLLEVACRVGGAYIANVHEYANGFSLWREWAKLELASDEKPYSLPKLRKEYSGVALCLAKNEKPDTFSYVDEEIVYRVDKKRHVGLIVHSAKYERVQELLAEYRRRFSEDFLDTAPIKERYDD
jgi:biotin carboxylase